MYITFDRSNQIASNSVFRSRGPLSIDSFRSLIILPFVTEIQLKKLRAHFRACMGRRRLYNIGKWENVHQLCSTVSP